MRHHILGIIIIAVAACYATAEMSEEFDSLCYSSNSTHFHAIEDGTKYCGAPEPLGSIPEFGYIRPFSGYVPQCNLSNRSACSYLPVQTSNIKVAGIYEGNELKTNKWMDLACQEALTSVQNGGGPFGAVILQIDDETLDVIRYWRNHNHVVEWHDPIAHAEISVIQAACKDLGVYRLDKIHKSESKLPQKGETSHCEIYSSDEPCPMCYAGIAWARIPKLYFAATRFDAAQQGVDSANDVIYKDVETEAYKDRNAVQAYQCLSPYSLDAFNYWKRNNGGAITPG